MYLQILAKFGLVAQIRKKLQRRARSFFAAGEAFAVLLSTAEDVREWTDDRTGLCMSDFDWIGPFGRSG